MFSSHFYNAGPTSNIRSRNSALSDESTSRTGSSDGVAVFLMLDKAPVVGEPISFTVNVINKQNVAKTMKVHLNAQAKEYNHSPSDTFWETHGVIQLAPMDGKFTLIHRLKC